MISYCLPGPELKYQKWLKWLCSCWSQQYQNHFLCKTRREPTWWRGLWRRLRSTPAPRYTLLNRTGQEWLTYLKIINNGPIIMVLAERNCSPRSIRSTQIYTRRAVKLYSNNKCSSTRTRPLWTNWIISRELPNDLVAFPAVVVMSSVLVNVALAFSCRLIDISLEPFCLWFERLGLSQCQAGAVKTRSGRRFLLDIYCQVHHSADEI